MSRSERRAYQRMTRKQDPYAPPPAAAAARARADARRAQQRPRGGSASADGRLLSGRATWWVVGGGVAAFLLGLSLAWPQGAGTALLIGAVAGVAWVVASVGFLVWRRREGATREAAGQRPPP